MPTPLSIGIAMSQISRFVVGAIAIPSMKCYIHPATYVDYLASIPHPNSACAFELTVPRFLALAGSVMNAYGEAYTSVVPPAPLNAQSRDMNVSVEEIQAKIKAASAAARGVKRPAEDH